MFTFNNELCEIKFIINVVVLSILIIIIGLLLYRKFYKKSLLFHKLAICVLAFIISCSCLYFIGNYNFKFYDRYGNEYSTAEEVPIYDKYGRKYVYRFVDPLKQEYIGEDGTVYSANNAFLTIGGYVEFVDLNELTFIHNELYISEKNYYVDENGEKYFILTYPRWDHKGKLWLGFDKDFFSFDKETQDNYCQNNNIRSFID